jgi:hypothetical protein
MAKRRRHTLYLDEHVDPLTKELFAGVGFRCIRISESRYKGRDEHDYIDKLRAESAVFVTGDQRFIEHVVERATRHAGIIWIPATLLQSEKQILAAIMAGWMQGADLRQMKNLIMYLAHDGIHLRSREKDELVYSFPAILRDFDEFLAELRG